MPIGPSFDSLDRTATTLDGHADELRRRVTGLEIAVSGLRWESPSARAFQRRHEQACTQLRSCATGLERAATELRRHAQDARNHFGAAAHAVEAGVGELADLGAGAIEWALG